MAINKRKILQSAQKNLQRGALDKALKDYETLLKADPRDTNVRLKMGDLYLRRGHTDQAVSAYLKVASQFMNDGFDAKAVAIYKQVTKLDPKRTEVHEPLAELYQRMGLVSEAMAALQLAAEVHQQSGRKREALELLRKMASLDPTNTSSRLKVAELLRQEGLQQEAVAEYLEVAAELERQEDREGVVAALGKLLELDPQNAETLERIVRTHLAAGQPQSAEPMAKRFVKLDPDSPAGYELLGEVYQAADRRDELPDVYRRLAETYRKRGDEDKAREILQRFVPLDSLVAGDAGSRGVFELPSDTEAAPASPGSSEAPATPPSLEVSAPDLVAEGDPDQLLAEANVYLRYGKHDRAIANLRAILEQEPDHAEAVEKLAEAYTAIGDMDQAIQFFVRAAEFARQRGDTEHFDVLRGRVAALDVHAAQALEVGPAEGADAPKPDSELLLDDEVDFELDESIDTQPPGGLEAAPESVAELEGGSEPGPPPLAEGDSLPSLETIEDLSDSFVVIDEVEGTEPVAPSDEAPDTDSFETIDAESFEGVGAGESTGVANEPEQAPGADAGPALVEASLASEAAESEAAPDHDVEIEVDIPEPSLADFAEEGEEEAGAEAAPAGSSQDTGFEDSPDAAPQDQEPEASGAEDPEDSSGSAQQIAEELEEADFYLQQGMYDEAEAVYRRVLSVAPQQPQALLRIGEIEAARARETAAPVAPSEPDTPRVEAQPAPAPQAEDLTQETFGSIDAEIDPFEELVDDPTPPTLVPMDAMPVDDGAMEPESPSPPQETPAARAAPEDGEPEAALDDEPEAALDDEPETALEDEPDAREAPRARPLAETTAPEILPPAPGQLEASEEAGEDETFGEDEAFDLAAELSGALDGGEANSATEEHGFETLFQEFKRGVQETLGEEDGESRYDLGIAYREMGLLDDALEEFRTALSSAARRLDALHMFSLCALDLGRPDEALDHLEQVMTEGGLPDAQQVALGFDLGCVYEARGNREQALQAYRAVAAIEPDFEDVGARIAALEAPELPPATEPPEATEASPSEEGFESFEDFLADEELAAEPEPVHEPEPAAEPAPVADPEPMPEAAETFESFDDVVEAVDPGEDGAPGGADQEAEPPSASEPPDSGSATDSGEAEPGQAGSPPEPEPPRRPKRRKISFV